MNYLLLGLLVFEVMFIYRFNGKNVISPSFIACCGFVVSSTVLVLAEGYFQYELQLKTVVIITSMVLFIFFGEMFSSKIRLMPLSNSANNSCGEMLKYEEIKISKTSIAFMFVFVSATGIFYILDVYKYSLTIGNITGNIFGMAKYTRFIGGYSSSILISQSNVLSECMIYLCFFAFVYNLLINKRRKLYYLLPMVGFVFHILANDGRTVVIKYFCICGIIYFLVFNQKNNWKHGDNKKIIRISITMVLLFLVLFRILGYRTGSSANNELWKNLAEYISSGLIGLDKFLIYGQEENILFGQEVFKALYSTLRGFGFQIPMYDPNDVFFAYAGGSSNIYTGLKSYIKDFSLIGAYFSMFLWGACNTALKKKINKKGASLLNTVLLGLSYYPIAMISIAGATHVVLSMPTLYMIVYLIILSRLFMKKTRYTTQVFHDNYSEKIMDNRITIQKQGI